MNCSLFAIIVVSLIVIATLIALPQKNKMVDPVSLQVLTGPISYNKGNDQSLFQLNEILNKDRFGNNPATQANDQDFNGVQTWGKYPCSGERCRLMPS